MTYIAPKAKLFGHMDRLAEAKEDGITSAPVNVEIDLSNRCSLGCEWCHFSYTHSRGPLAGSVKPDGAVSGGDLMDSELAKRILGELADAGVRSVTLTGGGEPTLHPDFDDIVEFATRLDMALGLYTHGGHVTTARASLLKRAMTFVYVSLDAADPDSYKQTKGVDRFKAACDGIRLLADAEGDATIGVGFLVTKDNYQDIPKAAYLAEALGADYLQARPTVRYEQNTPGIPAEHTAWMADAINVLNWVSATKPILDVDTDRFRMYQTWQGHGYDTCWWSTLQSCITPNGKVWVCVSKREHAGAEIGDLSVESFADVWARHSAVSVTDDCRVMCRGHLPNLALDQIMADRLHPEFV